jgi:hypothetical protein
MASITANKKVQDWVFTQKRGDKKTFRLSGWDAPHGRARKGPVVKTGVRLRQKTQYYSGNPIPTRHVFGTKREPIELSGRFMDAYGGAGHAIEMRNKVIDFVEDGIPCTITWGQLINYDGIIEVFDPGIEDQGNVEWRMTVLINADNESHGIAPYTTFVSPSDRLASIIAQLSKVPQLRVPFTLPGIILDELIIATTGANLSLAQLVSNVSQIDAIDSAPYADVARMRSGISLTVQSLLVVKELLCDTRSGSLLSVNADMAIQLQDLTAQSDIALIATMGLLEQMDRDALVAQRGQIQNNYVAQTGDTWERIAITFYGSIAGATTIKDANGIRFGTAPTAGATYIVPAFSQ